MFYITISNGLLSNGHRKRIGSAIWEFMWLIDKITKIDDKGMGWVLGGKPINLKDIVDGVDEDTISRNLDKLEKEGYIKKIRTPYGLSIRVMKAKKSFGKNAESIRNRKNAESLRENAVSNKTIHIDNSRIDTEQGSEEIEILIKSFETINPASKDFYGRPPQRKACKNLIDTYSFERVKNVIEKTLPKTNNMQFFPTITTPMQLRDKWAMLESAINKKKSEKLKNKTFIV